MIKSFSLVVFLFLCFFVVVTDVEAESLVNVDSEGMVRMNVLSIEDNGLEVKRSESIEIKESAVDGSAGSKLSLNSEDGRLSLKVSGNEGEQELDVTGYDGNLVELEERGEVEAIQIIAYGGGFALVQDGMKTVTSYPISIDPKSAELSLSTPSGTRFLSVLPKEAVSGAIRARVLSFVNKDEPVEVYEKDGSELLYVVNGEKRINLFNLMVLNIPVKTEISASTGEIVYVDQPTWLRVFGFLFS